MSGNVGKMNDPDASLFIQVSEITGSTQRGAIVDLVKDLKSNNLWSKMKAILSLRWWNGSNSQMESKRPTGCERGISPNVQRWVDAFEYRGRPEWYNSVCQYMVSAVYK
jgi:hypothetical protein